MTEAPGAAAVEAMDTPPVNSEDPYQSIAFQEALDDVDSIPIPNWPRRPIASSNRRSGSYEDILCDPHPELDLPRYPNFKPFVRALWTNLTRANE
jgi:hypothetical protein